MAAGVHEAPATTDLFVSGGANSYEIMDHQGLSDGERRREIQGQRAGGAIDRMSAPLTFEELRKANTDRLWEIHLPREEWTPNDWAVATAGELGETLNLLKKRRRGEAILTGEIAAELADTVIYLDLLAESLGIDLGEAVREKFNRVSERYRVEVKL